MGIYKISTLDNIQNISSFQSTNRILTKIDCSWVTKKAIVSAMK